MWPDRLSQTILVATHATGGSTITAMIIASRLPSLALNSNKIQATDNPAAVKIGSASNPYSVQLGRSSTSVSMITIVSPANRKGQNTVKAR